ncbi:uncharacterized protein LOC122658213 [Telopea speciosissima]|uniref:uncharacterized protein LOC122658213 n=1 Tax=Telopea speciosissima TaxID=54955 RepID=UPI001CC7DCBD|nr:uncharacterized protein LOC122658213 [Telopea speciosissima]
MDLQQEKINKKKTTFDRDANSVRKELLPCTKSCCFFCTMKEPNPSLRASGIAKCFKEIPQRDDQEHVLVLSGLWNLAMTQPNDPEFPSLGIFECMASLINKGINNHDWLLRDQNIYIPYYSAHVIGSYTMNKAEFAEKAVKSGVIPPLIGLLRGKISWVEQRVAVRALGHLASYERTFKAVAEREEEIVNLAMNIASTCFDSVYANFIRLKEKKRSKYQRDLLTRGVGDFDMENRKAEEWASQLQCWCLYLLNCFACKERSLNLICKTEFLKELCGMWGGLVNHSSPAGIGLIRILCYSETGRKSVSESKEVMESLCNLSRSSDKWQYMGIDCLLLLLRDPITRYQAMEIATPYLVDLVELESLGGREKLGDAVTETLLLDYNEKKSKFKKNRGVKKALMEIWDLKVERRKREKVLSDTEMQKRSALVGLLKQQGNERFWCGDIEKAVLKYSEALELCPLKMRKERVVLYSNRAQCHLLLRDPETAISDSTRALCLSRPANSHGKSLWRRSQAYDMKGGLEKESLIDSIVFVNGCCITSMETKRVKVPYYAVRLINKQMNATWLFAEARSKRSKSNKPGHRNGVHEYSNGDAGEHSNDDDMIMRGSMGPTTTGLSTILEEPLLEKGRWRSKLETTTIRRRKKQSSTARKAEKNTFDIKINAGKEAEEPREVEDGGREILELQIIRTQLVKPIRFTFVHRTESKDS